MIQQAVAAVVQTIPPLPLGAPARAMAVRSSYRQYQCFTYKPDGIVRVMDTLPTNKAPLGVNQQVLRTASASSGLLLMLFLVLHLAGVGLAPLAPQRFEAYAAALHSSALLPAAELALMAVALVHLGLSLLRAGLNRAAGNTANLRSRRTGPLAPLAAMAARSQAAGRVLLLGFLVVRLAQLRWPRPEAGTELAELAAALASP